MASGTSSGSPPAKTGCSAWVEPLGQPIIIPNSLPLELRIPQECLGVGFLRSRSQATRAVNKTAVCFTAARRIGVADQLRKPADPAQRLTQSGSLLDNAGLFTVILGDGEHAISVPLRTHTGSGRNLSIVIRKP